MFYPAASSMLFHVNIMMIGMSYVSYTFLGVHIVVVIIIIKNSFIIIMINNNIIWIS